ncbi:oxidoreductase [Klebsiella michiganensis]|uniref:Oxidoreductase n=1 Tax=Klebsiella michiganensis TaxID=1134687 RepID=A0A7H4M5Q3_9ENTR|nr:oxidoreductase [Klebsiella michiganensis]
MMNTAINLTAGTAMLPPLFIMAAYFVFPLETRRHAARLPHGVTKGWDGRGVDADGDFPGQHDRLGFPPGVDLVNAFFINVFMTAVFSGLAWWWITRFEKKQRKSQAIGAEISVNPVK